ncbi:MAG TPA: alpha/beta hydrolase-fold protein [Chloroflexota bacterium]|nr:alpha/beta hydrolase-fold protein [Chloroflexota bacterium]
MKSSFSRIVVAGAVVVSAAGWVGVQAAPAEETPAAPVAVRDRAAWQPSPVPAKYQAQPAKAPAAAPETAMDQTAVPAVPAALAGPAVQAPVSTNPAARLAGWLSGLFRRLPVRPGQPDEKIEAIPGASDVIPLDTVFHYDRLEELSGYALPAQRGEWRMVSFFSRALGRESTYMAWLPPGYASSNVSYPTLYLLHGVGDGETAFGVEEWLGYSLTEDLDRMLALGLIEPMIVVLPYGEQSYWMNHANGPKWGDFVAVDLVKHVDATFRTQATRERRAIGGLSMGGHGAVQLAYNHPDTFAIAGAHSPTIRPFETSPEFFGDQAHFAKYDPVSLAKAGAAGRVLTWIDVGADDQWKDGAEKLAAALKSRGAPFELRVLEGDHDGWYWKYYLPEYLHFYSQALHATQQNAAGAPQMKAELLTSSVSPSLLPAAFGVVSVVDGAFGATPADF